MFYPPGSETSGPAYYPFKFSCVPRPIGCISTISADGVHNLAPYSPFQNLTWDPQTSLIAANSRHDGGLRGTAANILATAAGWR